MNSDVLSLPEADGQILTFDIPDEVLERAATPEQLAFTGRSNSPNIGITAGAGGFWILSSPRNNPHPPRVSPLALSGF
jgi:hypothetical protein